MKNKALIIAIVLVVLAAAFGALYVSSSAKKKPAPETKKPAVAVEKVKIGNLSTVRSVDIYAAIATEKNIFKNNNLEVEQVTATGSSFPLLSSGQVDALVSPVAGGLEGYVGGQKFVNLGYLNSQPPTNYFVSRFPKSQANKIVKVGVVSHSTPQYYAMVALKKLGVDTSKVQYVIASNDKVKMALLDKGDLDMAFVDTDSITNKSAYTIISPREIYKDSFLPLGVQTTTDAIANKAEPLKRLLRSLVQAQQYVTENKTETVEFLKNHYQMKEDYANSFYDDLVYSQQLIRFDDDTKTEDLKQLETSVASFAKISNPRDISEFINYSFTKEALNNN